MGERRLTLCSSDEIIVIIIDNCMIRLKVDGQIENLCVRERPKEINNNISKWTL